MKRILLLFAIVLFSFGWNNYVAGQTDPCSLETIIVSFQAAVLSDSVDTWIQQYESSSCERSTIRAAQYFARGYQAYFNEFDEESIPLNWVGTGQGVANYRGNLSVNLGSYPDVGVTFSSFQNGRLSGTLRLGSGTATIPGSYYTSEIDIIEPELWDVIVGCEPDRVVVWLEWITSDPRTGSVLRGLLYVAVITDDNRMCAAAYDSSTGGQKVVDWVLSSQY